MPLYLYSSDTISATTVLTSSSNSDSIIVLPGVNVASQSGATFSATHYGTAFQIYGFIAGSGIDIDVGNSVGNYSILIGPDGGVVSSFCGIRMLGQNSEIFNEGSISGQSYGIIFGGGDATYSSTIFNSGSIYGGGDALVRYMGDLSTYKIINTGTIASSATGVSISGNQTDAIENVVNRGVILGEMNLDLGNDFLRNVDGGRIEGDVHLGGGDDRYHGRSGEVFGTIFGDAGDDVFTQNSDAQDIIDGGDNRDTINFLTDSAAIVALDGGFLNAGSATGDTYTNIEILRGSQFGDHFQGDDAANTFSGRGGDDILSGMAGNDLLIGGEGSDTMTGGDGFDRFSYENVNEFGDVITDFSNVSGNNDRFTFLSTAFNNLAIGTVVPGRFAANADHQAQDANDYFLYDTDDHELWYDVDGNGAAEAVLVAALETSTVLTYLDIEIV